MNRAAIRTVVRTTTAVMDRLAQSTQLPADDLMVQLLRANEERIVTVVAALLAMPKQKKPTDEDIVAALKEVGIEAWKH
jgi:hypothetical protein